jgi:hypothetical protein
MKSFVCKLATGLGIVLMATCGARGEETEANIVVKGPLAGLNQAASTMGLKDMMPAKLCTLLWPGYAATNRCEIRKLTLPGKDEKERKVLIMRVDNRDLVFARFVEIRPNDDSKIRREYYFRVTQKGDLALALEATFQFRISDTDTDLLNYMTLQAYGDKADAAANIAPLTPEIKAQFEAEKKLWLGQQKNLKKAAQSLDN